MPHPALSWIFTTASAGTRASACTPRQIYQEGRWICGRSAADRLRLPPSPSQIGNREMLDFDRISTGTTTNHKFDIDKVNSRRVKPAGAPAIGAEI